MEFEEHHKGVEQEQPKYTGAKGILVLQGVGDFGA